MSLKIVSRKFELENSHTLEIAKANGGYNAVEGAFKMTPEEITEEIMKSNLRGKGGGGGVTGTKWKNMRAWREDKGYDESFLIVNADESEPGTFKDRYILAKDPHLLIEGVIITAYALGAHDTYVYIRGEYTYEQERLQSAIDEAYAAGILGENACGTGYRVDFTIQKGAGAYICGEKTALLESLEGKRGHPRLKPHDRKEPDYLYNKPCVVNNVETIATVPFIVKNGFKAYTAVGTEKSPGTLLFGVSGHVKTPCVEEVPFGMPMMEYINKYAGGIWKGRELKAVIPGGSSCPVLTKEEAEKATLDYEAMWDLGTTLGTGGMIVMDETTDMVKALENLLDFYKEESCGQCTPCREGCGWSLKIVEDILHGKGKLEDLDTLEEICVMLNGKTVCVFAPAVKDVIIGFITKFREEFVAYIEGGKDGK